MLKFFGRQKAIPKDVFFSQSKLIKMEKRLVKTKVYIPLEMDGNRQKAGTGKWSDDFQRVGRFHQWGLDFIEGDNGFSSYSVGLIEFEDGSIESLRPDNFKFAL